MTKAETYNGSALSVRLASYPDTVLYDITPTSVMDNRDWCYLVTIS